MFFIIIDKTIEIKKGGRGNRDRRKKFYKNKLTINKSSYKFSSSFEGNNINRE